MADYDAVLFDNDGVLVAPPARETQVTATRAAFREMGVDDPNTDHVLDLVDGVTIEGLHTICRHYDLDPEQFWATRERTDERSQVAAFRANRREQYEDIRAITAIDRPRGIVSNNHHSTIEFVLAFFDIGDWFDIYQGRPKTIASLDRKKPNPYYLRSVLDTIDTTNALYVGDSQSDVLAAHRADIDSVFLRRRHCRDADLDPAPTYDVESLHAVVELVSS